MNKPLRWFLNTVVWLLLSTTVWAQTTYYVNDNQTNDDSFTTAVGDDNNPGTAAAPFLTLQKAVSQASDGDLIYVDAGTYSFSASLILSKSLKIYGRNYQTSASSGATRFPESVLELTNNVPSTAHILINASNAVELKGFKIQDNLSITGSPQTREAVVLATSNGHIVANNFFNREAASSSAAQNTSEIRAIFINPTVAGNTVTIEQNLFTGTATGIFQNQSWRRAIWKQDGAGNVRILTNKFANTRSHLNLDESVTGLTIEGNTFELPTGIGAIAFGSSGSTMSGTFTFGANEFTGLGTFVRLSSVSSSFVVDLTACTSGGVLLGNLPLADQFTLEQKLDHGNGLVRVKAGTLFAVPKGPITSDTKGIQFAINRAATNDVIQIQNNTYGEDLTINKPLTLNGESRNGVIVKGLLKNSGTPTVSARTIVVNAADVTIKNLTVTRDYEGTLNGWTASLKTEGIIIENKDRLTIDNVLAFENRTGIYLHNSKNSVVKNSEVRDNRTGFQVWGPLDNSQIINNVITNNYTHGIVFNFDQGPTSAVGMKISNNNLSGNWYTQISFQRNSSTPTTNVGNLTGLDLTCNWFGVVPPTATVGPVNLSGAGYTTQMPSRFGGTAPATTLYIAGEEAEGKNFIPYLNTGTDNEPATAGFQPVPNSCVGPVRNVETGETFATIQASINDTETLPGHHIEIGDGVYKERVVVSKSLSFTGQSETGTILNGTGLSGEGSAILISNGVTGVSIQKLTIQNYKGESGNLHAGIYANSGNSNLTITNVTIQNNPSASGIYANGPIENVTVDQVKVNNNGPTARGIVIWNGLKKNITITNSTVTNNNCCGIEMQDGSATGVLIKGNTIIGNDNAIGLVGLTSGSGLAKSNIVENNTITVNGRYGIEVKNPNGTGTDTETQDGAILIRNNTITFGSTTRNEDLAAIAVIRRGVPLVNGVPTGNVDIPTGVVVKGNTISGFQQPSDSEGFGIVIEGTNHTVSGNTISNTDVAIQQQAGHDGYPGDGTQSNLADTYFGRGNSPATCGNTVSGNTFSSNTVDTRNVGPIASGVVKNTTTNEVFCSIQSAINDTETVNGHTLLIKNATYNENVSVTKTLTLEGESVDNVILTPTTAKNGIGVDIKAANVVLKKLTITNYNYGVVLSANGNDHQILNVKATNNGVAGIALPYSSENIAISGLKIDQSVVKGNYEGLEVFAQPNGSKVFDNVTITNSDFSDNLHKGIYVERANNLVIDGVTVNNSGTDLSNGGNNNGIDVNLKFSSYSNITIKNSTITNSGTPGTGSSVEGGTAVSIKARDDGSTYGANPATLTGVLIQKNTISGPQNGIRIGEYGKVNAGPSNVVIENNDLSFSFSNKAVINNTNQNVLLKCNWLGTDNFEAAYAKLGKGGGTGTNIIESLASDASYTTCLEQTEFFVNDDNTSGDHYTTAIGSDTNPGTASAPFRTLNKAITTSTAGKTIWVDAGTYTENVIANKKLTIKGSNAGINPNTGTRLAESIILPATAQPNPLAAAAVSVVSFSGNTDEIIFDGFTVNGNNPALTSGVLINEGTVDVDASEGISANNGVAKALITNNIVKHVNYAGISFSNESVSGIPVTTGNVVSGNRFEAIRPAVYGIGVVLTDNAYTQVTANVMVGVRIGVQTGNFHKADTDATQAFHSITNNTIEASRKGIWHNLAYSNASSFIIKDNILTALASTARYDGIMISSLEGTVGTTVENNTITGVTSVSNGYQLWNNPSNLVVIKGGTVSNTQNGIFANNFDGYPDATGSDAGSSAYTVDGVKVQSSVRGLYVKDNASNTNNSTVQVNVINGTNFDGLSGENSVLIEGNDARVSTGTAVNSLIIKVKNSGTHNAVKIQNTTSGATTPQFVLNSGLAVNLNNNGNARALESFANSIVDLQSDYTAPNKVPSAASNPIYILGSFWFTNGILNSGNGAVRFGTTATDILTGPHAEHAGSYLLGEASIVGRPVNTAAVDILGVVIPAGANLGTLEIFRTTVSASGSISPAIPGNASIRTTWVISPSVPGSRSNVQFRFLNNPDNLNGQNVSSLKALRHNGTEWEEKAAGLTTTLTGDVYTTSGFNVSSFSSWTLSSAYGPIDLRPIVSRPISSVFTTTQEKEGVITLENASPHASTGTMIIRVAIPSNFTLEILPTQTTSAGQTVENSNWDISTGITGYTLTSKPGVVIGGTPSVIRIGYKVKATGVTDTKGIVTVSVLDQTGGAIPSIGDNNTANNQTVITFSIN